MKALLIDDWDKRRKEIKGKTANISSFVWKDYRTARCGRGYRNIDKYDIILVHENNTETKGFIVSKIRSSNKRCVVYSDGRASKEEDGNLLYLPADDLRANIRKFAECLQQDSIESCLAILNKASSPSASVRRLRAYKHQLSHCFEFLRLKLSSFFSPDEELRVEDIFNQETQPLEGNQTYSNLLLSAKKYVRDILSTTNPDTNLSIEAGYFSADRESDAKEMKELAGKLRTLIDDTTLEKLCNLLDSGRNLIGKGDEYAKHYKHHIITQLQNPANKFKDASRVISAINRTIDEIRNKIANNLDMVNTP